MRARFAWQVLTVCTLLACLLPTRADAVEPQLQVEKVYPLIPVIRDHAPIPVVIDIKWTGNKLLEGRLQCTLVEDSQIHGSYAIDGVVVQPSTRPSRHYFRLAGINTAEVFREISVRLTFIDVKGKPWPLGTHRLSGRLGASSWQGIAAAGVTKLGTQDNVLDLGRRLMLDALLNAGQVKERGSQNRLTRLVKVNVEDLTARFQDWFAWDMLVLDEQALQACKPRQLKALMEWLRRGGRLLLQVQTNLTKEHAALLQNLQSRTIAMPELPAQVEVGQWDHGRFVLVTGPLPKMDAQQLKTWRSTAAFMWSLDRPVTSLRIDVLDEHVTDTTDRYMRSGLYELLKNHEQRVVPLSVILLVLVCFVLAIGPGDWFLLGLLRRRVWTWVLFPVVAVVVTIVLMNISRFYLGSSESDSVLRVLDIDADGNLLTQHRFDYLYRPSADKVELSAQRGIMQVLQYQDDDPQPAQQVKHVSQRGASEQMSFHIGQWTPCLVRTVQYEAEGGEDIPLDFGQQDPGSADFVADMRRRYASLGDAFCLAVRDADGLVIRHGNADFFKVKISNRYRHQMQRWNPRSEDYSDGSPMRIWELINGKEKYGGFGSYLPRFGCTMRGLAVHPVGDQRLAIVAFRRGNDIVVIRRLYHDKHM